MRKHYILILIITSVLWGISGAGFAQNAQNKTSNMNKVSEKRSAQAEVDNPNNPNNPRSESGRSHGAQRTYPAATSNPPQPPIYSTPATPPSAPAVPSAPIKITADKMDETVADAIKSGRIMLNFDSIEIKTITKIMSDITNKTIILDRSVSGTITIISSRKVSISEAWELYLSALEASGFGIVASGSAYKVIPIQDAKKENVKYVGTKTAKQMGTDYVVALVLLNNADAELMMNTLRPLVQVPGVISAYNPSNAVVITDTSSNVSRITQIIKQLDTNFKGTSMRVFQPRHIRVKELAAALTAVFQGNVTAGATSAGLQVKIAAYEPTNTLLVMAPTREFLQIEAAISEIDVEDRVIKSDERNFKVYYLRNADAEEVSKSISLLLEEKKKLVEAIKTEQQGTEASKTPETVVSTRVAFDKATNSLMFYISEKEYKDILPMIERIDAPQKQVLITSIIAETQMDNSLDAGIAWQVVSDPGIIASFQGGFDQTGIMNSLSDGRFAVGGIGSEMIELNIGGSVLKVPKLFGIIKAIESKTNFNLLSSPKIVTHDHKEAKIVASQQLPFATGVKYDNNNQPVINYEYKDVGLTLNVTPHIGQHNQVKLDLNLAVKDLVSYLTQGTGASTVQIPIISNRELKNIVTLGNGETIVIGGLIDQKTTEVIKQVPILSKIPLIGGLFKEKSTRKNARTLFVFITPYIIDTPEDLQKVTDTYGRTMFKEKINGENQPLKVTEEGEKK